MYLVTPSKRREGMNSPTEVIGTQRGPIVTIPNVGRYERFTSSLVDVDSSDRWCIQGEYNFDQC